VVNGRFDYIKFDDVAVNELDLVKVQFEKLCGRIGMLPDGRGKSLALTKLEESYMWCGKAIRDDQVNRTGSSVNVPERSDT
jgi:hypothetical protein